MHKILKMIQRIHGLVKLVKLHAKNRANFVNIRIVFHICIIIVVTAKRINYLPYEKLVLLAILRWIEELRRKKKMPRRHSQISKMRMLMSPRGPVNSWKLAGKKKKIEKSTIA